MKPYYEEEGIKIYLGDCREIVPSLDFDVIVCDPPYGLGIEFGRRNERVIGDEAVSLRNWISALPRPQLCFGSPRVDRPVGIRATLIWDKSELTGMGDLDFPWKITHEEIYVIGEGFSARRRKGSVLRHPLRPVWSNHADAVTGTHPTEKPVSLMIDLLDCCPWEKVLDPTCGTGTTLIAARRLGKNAIGIEIEECHAEIAAKRLAQRVLQFD